MLSQIKNNSFFFSSFFLLAGLCLYFNIRFSKAETFQFVNTYHSDSSNTFFEYYTYLGDGMISIFTALILLLFKKRKEAILLFAAFATSGIIAQLIKNLIDSPRPKLYFEESMINYSHFIKSVTLSGGHSFPSGHTASAFAMAAVFVLISNKRWVAVIALIAAVLVACSRMYLGQHFLQDVLAGSIIGVLCAMVCYYYIYQKPIKIVQRFHQTLKPTSGSS